MIPTTTLTALKGTAMNHLPTTHNPTLPRQVLQIQPPTVPVQVPKRTRHGMHLLMCLFTGGAWLPVYGICALLNAGKTETKWVTR